MRSFSEFRTTLDQAALGQADQARLRSLAAWAYLLLRPGMEFVRQRSNFILGWQAAASSGQAVSQGVSAGAVGRAGVPPLGSWMILPHLTTPATRTVLPKPAGSRRWSQEPVSTGPGPSRACARRSRPVSKTGPCCWMRPWRPGPVTTAG